MSFISFPNEAPQNDTDGKASPEHLREVPAVFEERWVNLGDRPGFLAEQPPPTKWALTRWHGGRDVGVLPRGKTGLLQSPGGLGKTYVLIQLTLAFATATSATMAVEGDAAFDDYGDDPGPAQAEQPGFWLGTFRAAPDGHVLLALGEEDLDEVHRRLWRAANALELSAEQRRAAEQRIHVLPLHGMTAPLTKADERGQVDATDIVNQLIAKLDSFGVDWSMLIFDPLSRWASGGVESNNEQATRFCQVVERFTAVRGNPAVIVAHHSAKVDRETGKSTARGVSAIRDGFRWAAAIDPVEDKNTGQRGVRFRNDKSNYSPMFDDLMLVRSEEPGSEGTLRLAAEHEAEGLVQAGSKEAQAQEREAREGQRRLNTAVAVARLLLSNPGICERQLARTANSKSHIGRDRLQAALDRLGDAVVHGRPGARGAIPLTLDRERLDEAIADELENV